MKPFFLDSSGRRLFAISGDAEDSAKRRGAVLLLPPLFEEMNAARSMHRRLAVALNRLGFATLSVDMSGTGDSSGDIVDADIQAWRGDISVAADWLFDHAKRVSVIACRSAALMLPLLPTNRAWSHLCLVDPKIDGEAFMRELLRVRVLRSMFEGKREAIEDLLGRVESGEAVEAAGYEIPASLFLAISSLGVQADKVPPFARVHLVAQPDPVENAQNSEHRKVASAFGSTSNFAVHVLGERINWDSEHISDVEPLIRPIADFLTDSGSR